MVIVWKLLAQYTRLFGWSLVSVCDLSAILAYKPEAHFYLYIILTEVENNSSHGSHKSTVLMHCVLLHKQICFSF